MKGDQKARRRFLGGHKPFGYRVTDDGELVVDEAEQAAIARMAAMRKRGKSFRAISAALAKKDVQISREGVRKLVAAAGEQGAPR